MTIQGHPEMTMEISRCLSEGDDGTYKPGVISASDVTLRKISAPHDGGAVWDWIMKWALEED